MEFIKNFFEGNSQMALISMGITALAHIFFALSVYFDSKVNHIKYRIIWILLSLIFGAPPVMIYFIFRRRLHTKVPIVCTKCGKKAPKGAKECPRCGNTHFAPLQYENLGAARSRTLALLMAAAILLAFDAWYTQYSPWAPDEDEVVEEIYEDYDEPDTLRFGYVNNGKVFYYSRNKTAYTDATEVPLYDKDGNEYAYDSSKGYVFGDKVISEEAALVDSNGYLVDSVTEFGNVPSTVPFQTQDGTMYYRAADVSWNKDGKMVYTSNGNPIN